MFEDVRNTLRDRIEHGATLDEVDTIVRMSRGLNEEQRSALWIWAWHYDPRSDRCNRVDAGLVIEGARPSPFGRPGSALH